MPPPSPLKIKTSSVIRLIKEEQSYHKELASQQAKVEKMEDDNEDFYDIKKQKEVLVETEKMIPEVQKRLRDAVEILELELETIDEETEEKAQALKAMEEAKLVYENQKMLNGNGLFTDVS
jgi:tubulin-specific chaperone A